MRAHVAHLQGLRARIDPLRFDWLIAGALTLGAELEVWLTNDAERFQIQAALIALVVWDDPVAGLWSTMGAIAPLPIYLLFARTWRRGEEQP